MLKRITGFFMLTIMLASVLSSCTRLPSLTLYTGGERGTYYNLGQSIAGLFTENEDTSGEKDETRYRADINVMSSSGYKQNIDALVDKSADLAIVRNDIAYSALSGTGCYSGDKKEGFSAVGYLYSEKVHILVKEEITDASMLEGKRIVVGEKKESANSYISEQILSALGVSTYEKLYMSVSSAVDEFAAGNADAMFIISGLPSSNVKSMSSSVRFSILPIGEDVIKILCDKYPYFSSATISKKEYSVLKSNVKTVGLYATLLISDDIKDETAYSIAERLAEDTFLMRHDKAEEILPETMWKDCCVELHEGADLYYKKYLKKLEKETTAEETTVSPDAGDVTEPD